MPAPLEFTGERFLPGVPGDIAYEHWHRYAFAQRFVAGRRVLDAACGEGYGTALLARAAAQAIGLDVDPAAVEHARTAYAGRANLRFEPGSVAAIPLPDASVDVITSFETIEHLPADDQPRMLAEFARVLAPGGLLVISSPNRRRYSDARHYANPFHLHELYRTEFARLLDADFAHQRWFHQSALLASAVWSEVPGGIVEAWTGDGRDAVAMPVPEAMYFVVVAGRSAEALPGVLASLSVYADEDDSEMKRAEANAAEVLRLDALLRGRDQMIAYRDHIVVERDAQLAERNAQFAERDAQLAERNAQLVSRNAQLAERDALLAERNAQIAEGDARLALLEDERQRQEAALAAQGRLLAYQQSLRGWLRWPVLRIRLLWKRWTST